MVVHCIALYFIVNVHCIKLQRIALRCVVCLCIALYCIVLHCIALYCILSFQFAALIRVHNLTDYFEQDDITVFAPTTKSYNKFMSEASKFGYNLANPDTIKTFLLRHIGEICFHFMNRDMRKEGFGIFDQVGHKPVSPHKKNARRLKLCI